MDATGAPFAQPGEQPENSAQPGGKSKIGVGMIITLPILFIDSLNCNTLKNN
jgi:hypothetical protein